jgi:hypothetical protein
VFAYRLRPGRNPSRFPGLKIADPQHQPGADEQQPKERPDMWRKINHDELGIEQIKNNNDDCDGEEISHSLPIETIHDKNI